MQHLKTWINIKIQYQNRNPYFQDNLCIDRFKWIRPDGHLIKWIHPDGHLSIIDFYSFNRSMLSYFHKKQCSIKYNSYQLFLLSILSCFLRWSKFDITNSTSVIHHYSNPWHNIPMKCQISVDTSSRIVKVIIHSWVEYWSLLDISYARYFESLFLSFKTASSFVVIIASHSDIWLTS